MITTLKNFWISGGLLSSSSRRRRGKGRGEWGEWREKVSVIKVYVVVNGANSEIKVERRCGHAWSAEDFSECHWNHYCWPCCHCQYFIYMNSISVRASHSARADISMPVYNDDICAYIGFLIVNILARGGMMSQGTRKGAVIQCLVVHWQVDTVTQRQRDRSRVNRTGNGASSHARRHWRIATPPDCTFTKAIHDVAMNTGRTDGSRRACTRGSLLTRMRDVNSATGEIIRRRPRENRSSTHGVSRAVFQQMSVYDWSVCNSKANCIPIIAEYASTTSLETLTSDVMFMPNTTLKYLTVCQSSCTGDVEIQDESCQWQTTSLVRKRSCW